MDLFSLVLQWMLSLAPERDHRTNAAAISASVLDARPLFVDDDARVRTAALVVAVAFRESSFRNEAKSKTDDACMMQVHRRPDLADDVTECVRVALSMLRASMRACPQHPLAFYASGPAGCSNARAQRISRDRMAIAARLVREVSP